MDGKQQPVAQEVGGDAADRVVARADADAVLQREIDAVAEGRGGDDLQSHGLSLSAFKS